MYEILAVSICIILCAVVLGMQFNHSHQLSQILSRIEDIERYCQMDADDMAFIESSPGEYHSIDGKYQANTIDELMRKMMLGDMQIRDDDAAKFLQEIDEEPDWIDQDMDEDDFPM